MDVARQFRFTTEEVKEYYDKCGDINRTSNRFRKMREVLMNLRDDDEELASPDTQPVVVPMTRSRSDRASKVESTVAAS